jgi:hypothetical protein
MERSSAAGQCALLVTLAIGLMATAPVARADIPAQGAGCTLYAAPNGNDGNTGTSSATPLTLTGAASRTVPGSVVCLLGGTYARTGPLYLTRSGKNNAWIVFRNYNGVAELNYDGPSDDVIQVAAQTQYIEVDGLQIQANNKGATGLKCSKGAAHVRFVSNTVLNAGASGISTVGCDYVVVDSNVIFHTGYLVGWGSGISLNSSVWSDRYAGFHSFVVNNIVAGSVDNSSYHTDGNGIIMDLSEGTYDPTSGTYNLAAISTPSVLIANNLIYENGGRCIHSFAVTHIWVVNNTCYKNSLDQRLVGPEYGEITELYASDIHVINNLVDAWSARHAFVELGGAPMLYSHNGYHQGEAPGPSDPTPAGPFQLRRMAPLFVNPPPIDSTADDQFANAVPPDQLGGRFRLKSNSPALSAAMDPRLAPGLTTILRAGLAQYVLRDLAGTARPQGSYWDLGAYEYVRGAARSVNTRCQPVSWTHLVNVQVNGDALQKTGTRAAWDAGAVGTASLTATDGSVQVTVDGMSYGRMIGLAHGAHGPSYTGITYALELQSNGTLDVYESGQWRAQVGSYSVGDMLKVAVAQGAVQYFRNSTLLYTSSVAPSYPLAVAASIRDPGGRLVEATICAGRAMARPTS